MMTMKKYQVHWARANRADEIVALRSHAIKHLDHASAEAEAASISPPRADLVTIVCEVISHPSSPAASPRAAR
jgi:hypothetical protein